ncbi:hypothetical protein HS1genome_0605 [Sulfodiicoccus acidiphilus]|uniref:Uncharacterized protein n=1 Tax=Sulfodiicoccus acidiphilus TaxID=1670455 RepID=A0A348B214_9CREN|nr:hypothetical protein [Sulfodiicoccus acidiphilus]BBD72216.1 hypothetical protein HS1genome_0605 [Sulfodiicoccus acidiphilus]GGU02968.1 hypothetical protein GCM10007116_19980 [Sulfodiicoccus acidiphilus]
MDKSASKFAYLGIALVVIGVIMMGLGTTKYVFPREVFSGVNGMYEVPYNVVDNYFVNFVGLAVLLFGVGALLSYVEMKKRGVGTNGR